jgi:hypothetical protein
VSRIHYFVVALLVVGHFAGGLAMNALADEPADRAATAGELIKSARFYASFDESTTADFGQGDLQLWTRYGQPARGNTTEKLGVDEQRVRIARGRGVHRGALELAEVLPNDGFVFFRAAGKLAPREDGWGGAVSLWLKGDLAHLKTDYCDPVMVVQNRYNNGSVWSDFAPGKPRDLRLGLFPTLPEGRAAAEVPESQQPVVRAKAPDFQAGVWHHLVLTWDHFDTGRTDGRASLYLDGRQIAAIQDRPADMHWQLDRVRIFLGAAFVGLVDEVATFDHALSQADVALLHSTPNLLATLKKR